MSSHRFSLRSAAVVAVVAVALVATVASGEDDTAEKVDGQSAAQQQSTEFAVGDTVELGDWQVKVYGVQDPYISQNEFITPSDGNRYVVVDTEVTNKSDESQVVSSMMCFELRDETNRSYDIALTDDMNKSVDGDVAAGSSRRGNLSYEVPETSKKLQLQFKCDLFGSGSALIDLS